MHRSRFLGYLAYPLLTFFSPLSAHLIAQAAGTPQNQAPAPSDATPAPDTSQPLGPPPAPVDPLARQQQQQSNSQSNPQSYPNEQDRIRLAREAQARVRARRQQRTQAVIQDTYSHKYDAYFGYGYLRFRPGSALQHVTEYGWNIGITDYIRPKLGITGDFRGYYGNAYVGNNPYARFEPFISNYSIMGGPQYRFIEGKTWGVSGQVLAGITRSLFDGDSSGFPGTLLGLYPNQWRFAAAVGAPVDYNLGPGLAVRITPTYYFTNFGGEAQNNLGFTAGAVYRFGRR
jgi:hypothetical protein